jgi:hypothetical protein
VIETPPVETIAATAIAAATTRNRIINRASINMTVARSNRVGVYRGSAGRHIFPIGPAPAHGAVDDGPSEVHYQVCVSLELTGVGPISPVTWETVAVYIGGSARASPRWRHSADISGKRRRLMEAWARFTEM